MAGRFSHDPFLLLDTLLPLLEPVSRRGDARSAAHEQHKLAKRLKKRKLLLKDNIAKLESALIPDEPA
jgi:hypothetical protein